MIACASDGRYMTRPLASTKAYVAPSSYPKCALLHRRQARLETGVVTDDALGCSGLAESEGIDQAAVAVGEDRGQLRVRTHRSVSIPSGGLALWLAVP